MGTYIKSYAEKINKATGKWEQVTGVFSLDDYDKKQTQETYGDSPFYLQDYFMFGIFANIRNEYGVKPISLPRGLPIDTCGYIVNDEAYMCNIGVFGASYLTLRELLEFNYDEMFVSDRDDEHEEATYRERLNYMFFTHLEQLKLLGDPDDVRIVFWFH